MISNAKPLSLINQLLQLGLIDNQKKISYGRIIMQDPAQGVYSMVYRDLAIEIFNKLIDYSLNDMVIYNRLRQLLGSKHQMKEDAFNCLVEKAEKAGIDLFLVLEKYDEGYKQEHPMHLTREQRAFNHVNAFLADCVEVDPAKREQGTDELADLYKKQTPGQSTLKTIKKALKK